MTGSEFQAPKNSNGRNGTILNINYQPISEFIKSIGFPIVVSLILFYFLYKQNEVIPQLTQSVQNLTNTVATLKTSVDKQTEILEDVIPAGIRQDYWRNRDFTGWEKPKQVH